MTMTRSIGEEMEEETNNNNNNNDVITVVVGPTTDDMSREDMGPLSLLRKFPKKSSTNSNLNRLTPVTHEDSKVIEEADSFRAFIVVWGRGNNGGIDKQDF